MFAPDGSVTVNVDLTSGEEVVSSDVTASLVLQGISKDEFGATKQLNFRRAVAKAAMVDWSQVTVPL